MAEAEQTPSPLDQDRRPICYRAYRPTHDECQAQERFLQESLGRSDTLLTLLYRVWLACTTQERMKPPPLRRREAEVAHAVRQLLNGELATRRNKGDCAAFWRFARLFLDAHDRRAALPPYYAIMDDYWRGIDIVPTDTAGTPATRIMLLPQPTRPDIPPLRWVFDFPLQKNTIVCAAHDITSGGALLVEAGRLGRLHSAGTAVCHVQFQDYPHIILCLHEMLMLPVDDLPRAVRPRRCP